MAYILPEKVRSLIPYQPVTGYFKLRLDANESCFALPEPVQEEIQGAIGSLDFNRYPDPYASECCTLAARRYGVKESQVVAGNGSDELISLIENCLLPRGAKLASFDMDFSMYAFYASLAELTHISLQKNSGLSIDVDSVIQVVNALDIDCLIFSNPCNPTSLLLPREQVERLVRSVKALVVVDEAYMEFAQGPAASQGQSVPQGAVADQGSVIDLIGTCDNLLVLKTCSKAIGLAGMRMGFALADEKLIQALKSAKSPYNVNVLSQLVVACVLREDTYVEDCAKKLRRYTGELYGSLLALQELYPALLEMVYPTCTNFVLVKTPVAAAIQGALRAQSISVRLLEGYLRITTGTPEDNRQVIANLREILRGMDKKAR